MTMKKRFALVAMVYMAIVSIPVGAQVKGLNKEEGGSSGQKLVAPDGAVLACSSQSRSQAGDEITQYVGAVPVRKIK
jgi:hypothetical protein